MRYIPGGVAPPPPRQSKSDHELQSTGSLLSHSTSGGVARLSSPPKAAKHCFREMGIGSVDLCCVLCLKMFLRFGVLCCDRAAVFDGGHVHHSTCVVL